MNESEKNHNKHTKHIALHPKILGIEGLVLSTSESHIISNKQIIRQPDNLVFDPSTHTLYNIEYKTNDGPEQYDKAYEQLHNSSTHLSNIFPGWDIKKLYISGRYKVQEVE